MTGISHFAIILVFLYHVVGGLAFIPSGIESPSIRYTSKMSISVVDIYNADGKKNLSTKEIDGAYKNICDIVKGDDDAALIMVKKQPDLIRIALKKPASETEAFSSSLKTMRECFDIYEETFGYDKALGMCTRNPNLLCIRPTGYGSAEAAGNDALYISYLIDATRGKGQYPLIILALLLLSKAAGVEFPWLQ